MHITYYVSPNLAQQEVRMSFAVQFLSVQDATKPTVVFEKGMTISKSYLAKDMSKHLCTSLQSSVLYNGEKVKHAHGFLS
jgi:hypothetical protein